jgi:hypothetical protein
MSEYIDREAANLALAEQGFDWDKVKQALASVPVADVAPVVHGRWERRRNVWYCTNCGKGYKITYGAVAANMHNYCPHCGAVMDGGAE